MMMAEDLPSDNIYAYALSKTLTKVSSPLTVGLYSSCHQRINMVLKNIEVHMEQEAERREQRYKGRSKPRSVKASITNFLALISSLLFYQPVWTEENQGRKNVRYVFVRFSAWHFAGSDLLWAGLVMQLCKALQMSFGKLQLSLFRVAQYDEEEDADKKKIEDSLKDWRSKKICCLPLWFLVMAILVGALIILILLVKFGFRECKEEVEREEEGAESDGFGVLEGFAIATLGVPAAGAMRFTFLMGKNLVLNQDVNIRQGMDNQKMSEQLGFMSEVKKEMRLLSCFIHFMEVFERRKIRVVLEITNLDRCTPSKIVGVLDAINILLSDEESPFISLLAVDPEVLVQQVDYADGCFIKEDRAFGFLDRIVTLPFTVPPLCDASKSKVFWNIVRGQSEIPEAKALANSKTSLSVEDESSINGSSIKTGLTKEDSSMALIAMNHQKDKTYAAGELHEEEVERLIQSAFESIFLFNRSNLHSYISADTMSMRRVINSIRVSVVIMEALKVELPPAESIAAWVLLVDRWPCRLSWILQCLEDDQQRAEIDDSTGRRTVAVDDSKALWDVFSEHRVELHVVKEEVETLLDRDGDPELFEMFLGLHFKFTVGDADRFKLSTVNLDHSIRNELARIRGSTRLKGTGRSIFNSLPSRTVINMSTEDVCNELSRLNLPDKYAEVVKRNDLSGRVLIFNDPSDLKQTLQMTLGEWTTFRIHFLGLNARARLGQVERRPALIRSGTTMFPCSTNSEQSNRRIGFHA